MDAFIEWFMALWESDVSMRLYIVVIIAFIPITLIGIIASVKVDSTFRKYSHQAAAIGATAAQVARVMLDRNGLRHVQIVKIGGNLTDNYDPSKEVVSLSDSVYGSSSVSAIAVACHECGHAIQHAEHYVFARLRRLMVPVVNFANRLFFPIMLVGMLVGMLGSAPVIGNAVVIIGLVVFSFSMLFSLITLPTEFNASSRAQEYLRDTGVLSGDELRSSKRVLRAAAMTYVASFLAAALQFLRLLAILLMMTRRSRK